MPTPNAVPTVGLIGAGATTRRQTYQGSPVNLKLHSEVNKAANLGPAMQELGNGLKELQWRWDGVALKEEYVKRKLELDNAKAEFDANSATGAFEDVAKAHEKMNAALKGFESFATKYSNHQASPMMQQLNDYSLEVENGLQASAAKKIKDYEIKTLGAETEMAMQDFGAFARKNGPKSFKDPKFKEYENAVLAPLRRQIELSGIDPDSELGQHMVRAGISKLKLNEGLNMIEHGDLHTSMAWLNRELETHGITTTDETTWLRAINAEKRRREAEARARNAALTNLSPAAQVYAMAQMVFPSVMKDYDDALKDAQNQRAIQKQKVDAFLKGSLKDQQKLTWDEVHLLEAGNYNELYRSLRNRVAAAESAIPTMSDLEAPAPTNYMVGGSPMMGAQMAQLAGQQRSEQYEAARAKRQKEIDEKTKEWQDLQQLEQMLTNYIGEEVEDPVQPSFEQTVKEMWAVWGSQEEYRKNAENPIYQSKLAVGGAVNSYIARLYNSNDPETAARLYNETMSKMNPVDVAMEIGGSSLAGSVQYIMMNGTDEDKKAIQDMLSPMGQGATGLAPQVVKTLIGNLPQDELERLAGGDEGYASDFHNSHGIARSDKDTVRTMAQVELEQRKSSANYQLYNDFTRTLERIVKAEYTDEMEQDQFWYEFQEDPIWLQISSSAYGSTDIKANRKKLYDPVFQNKITQAIERVKARHEAAR